ncbi:Squamosa promoter-binding-like protein 3, partial [Tetrabaena socialis]
MAGFAEAFGVESSAWSPSNYSWEPSSLTPERRTSGPASSDRDQSLGPLPGSWHCQGPPKSTRLSKGPLVCQVEGCGHDLSNEKGYYQRYRVCEPHLKMLVIAVEGKDCRFCQQCGRFHELTEFDGNKRSCRARLQQHNARRRKRDPLDTSRKDAGAARKAKAAAHPRSDSSNDAVRSGGMAHSADK